MCECASVGESNLGSELEVWRKTLTDTSLEPTAAKPWSAARLTWPSGVQVSSDLSNFAGSQRVLWAILMRGGAERPRG